MAATIRLVAFDIGGVMIQLTADWEESCARAGVPYRPLALTDAQRADLHQLEVAFSVGGISAPSYYASVRDVLHGLYTAEEIAASNQAVIREEFPGIHDTVCALNAAGIVTACLSNTYAPHWVDLTNPARYPGIAALAHQHASHLLGAAKPDAAIYQRFETAVGCAPAEILFFDDRRENIDAAVQCGWHAVHITEALSPVPQIHDALAGMTSRWPPRLQAVTADYSPSSKRPSRSSTNWRALRPERPA